MRVMLMCPRVFDGALCRSKVKNAACSLSLVGHPWITATRFLVVITQS